MNEPTSGRLAIARGWFRDHKIQINGSVYIITHLNEEKVFGSRCVNNGVIVQPFTESNMEVELDLLVNGWETYD